MSWRAPTGQRRGAIDWIELIFKDHGFLRVAWHNQHQIADGVWRSNQPGPGRIAKLADQGIKTIINLRGPRDDGGWQLEAEACKKAGITLFDLPPDHVPPRASPCYMTQNHYLPRSTSLC